jgi:cell division protein ZapA
MTDNHNKTTEKQPQNSPVKNAQVDNSQAQKAVSNNANTQSSAAAKVNSVPEPQIKKVDIAIAGVTYPIYCPVHEQEELSTAVSYINDYALNLKRDAPSLSQESLLVLCCLNLYEKIQTYERNEEDRGQQDKQSMALLNKVMQDAHSIL